MKKIIIAALLIISVHGLKAQINYGGQPYAFTHNISIPEEIVMPTVDVEKYIAEDMANTDAKKPFRFGAEIDTALNINNNGSWDTLPNGDRVWQLKITSKKAKSLNFIFSSFFVPKGGKVFIYTPDHNYIGGAFTEKSNNPDKVFSTSLYPGASVIIECYEPLSAKGLTELTISTVVHGYRDIFFKTDKGNYGTSGSCNININCSAGNDWQIEKRGVALILRGGSAHCTGALINNTANDETPYFLTAYHCINGYSPSNFVFVFQHEADNCNGTTGPTIYTINYASVIASGSDSDFALLKLNDSVPHSYNPYYLGWSKSSTAPTAMTCIHHPSGDIKKISHAGAGSSSSYLDNTDDGTHWKVSRWLQGTTEGGSSGSPLFDQNHQIIGQLHGGDASCSNTQGSDYYGKLAYSWTNGNTSSSSARLKDWLDPTNSGTTTCQGYDPITTNLSTDAMISDAGTDTAYCNTNSVTPFIRISNQGNDTLRTLTVKYRIDNQTPAQYQWTGNLRFNTSTSMMLNDLPATPGQHILTVWCENPNGSTDQNLSNDTITIPVTISQGYNISYQIKIPDSYAGYLDYFGRWIGWTLTRDDGTVLAEYDELTSSDFNESFCSDTGCYTLKLNISQWLTRVKDSITIKGYVNGQLLASATGEDSIQFCTYNAGISQTSSKETFRFYPNPTYGKKQIVVENLTNENLQYLIINTQGSVCLSGEMNTGKQNIDIQHFSAGIYYLKAKNKSGSTVKKLIVN